MIERDKYEYPTLWSCLWHRESKSFYSWLEIAEHVEYYLEDYYLESKFRWWLFWYILDVRDFFGSLELIKKGRGPLKQFDPDIKWKYWEYVFVFGLRNPLIRLYWSIKDFVNYKILRKEYIDPHLGCYSYPNCDEAPNGCRHVMGDDVETYGHRD